MLKVCHFSETFEIEFSKEFHNYTQSGYRSKSFDAMVNALHVPYDYFRVETEEVPEKFVTVQCLLCRASLATLLSDRRSGKTEAQLYDSAMNLCTLLTSYSADICSGLISLNIVSFKIIHF